MTDSQPTTEEYQDFLERIEELARVGGWELDVDTEAVWWSNGTRQIFEVPLDFEPSFDDAIGYFHPEDQSTVQQAVEECRDRGLAYDIEVRIVSRSGETRWVRVQGERLSGESLLRGVIQDITLQKEREQRLTVLNRTLRHNLRNKLNVITIYAEELQEELDKLEPPTSKAHEELMGVLNELNQTAYEIDSDLDAVEQVLTRIDDISRSEVQQKTEKIEEKSTELVSLGDKVSDFEHIIKNTDIHSSVTVRSVVEQVCDTQQKQHPDVEFSIDCGDVAVRGNEKGLMLLLEEVIDNAIQHNDKCEKRLAVHAQEEESGKVPIQVIDNGPGIPAMEREVIEQGDETPLMHGSGVGLWVVNWVVSRFRGEITITDNNPEGAIVEFSLPSASSE